MAKTREEMRIINEEVRCTSYAQLKVKDIGNMIADIASKIEFTSSSVEENFLEEKIYKDWVFRQRRDIKDLLAQIYSHLQLEEVKGHYDHAFERETKND